MFIISYASVIIYTSVNISIIYTFYDTLTLAQLEKQKVSYCGFIYYWENSKKQI